MASVPAKKKAKKPSKAAKPQPVVRRPEETWEEERARKAALPKEYCSLDSAVVQLESARRRGEWRENDWKAVALLRIATSVLTREPSADAAAVERAFLAYRQEQGDTVAAKIRSVARWLPWLDSVSHWDGAEDRALSARERAEMLLPLLPATWRKVGTTKLTELFQRMLDGRLEATGFIYETAKAAGLRVSKSTVSTELARLRRRGSHS